MFYLGATVSFPEKTEQQVDYVYNVSSDYKHRDNVLILTSTRLSYATLVCYVMCVCVFLTVNMGFTG